MSRSHPQGRQRVNNINRDILNDQVKTNQLLFTRSQDLSILPDIGIHLLVMSGIYGIMLVLLISRMCIYSRSHLEEVAVRGLRKVQHQLRRPGTVPFARTRTAQLLSLAKCVTAQGVCLLQRMLWTAVGEYLGILNEGSENWV